MARIEEAAIAEIERIFSAGRPIEAAMPQGRGTPKV